MSGVAMQRSNSILPACTEATRSSAPTISAPAALRFLRLGAASKHRDPQRAAGAVRQLDDAAHHLVGMLGVDAEIYRNLDRLVEFCGGAVFTSFTA